MAFIVELVEDFLCENISYLTRPLFLPVWPDREIIFPIFGHLLQWNYAQWPYKIPKVGSKIGQILNKPSKI